MRRVAQTPSEEMKWVPHTSVLRVGFWSCCFQFLSSHRIDRDGKIQPPTRKTDAWGTLASYHSGVLQQCQSRLLESICEMLNPTLKEIVFRP